MKKKIQRLKNGKPEGKVTEISAEIADKILNKYPFLFTDVTETDIKPKKTRKKIDNGKSDSEPSSEVRD